MNDLSPAGPVSRPRTRLSIRGTLLLLMAVGGAYLVGTMLVVLLVVQPAARRLGGHTQEILNARQVLRRDLAQMERAARPVRGALERVLATARPPSLLEADSLEATLRAGLDSLSVVQVSARLSEIPAEARAYLARAGESETAGGLAMLQALQAAESGHLDELRARVRSADSLLDEAGRDLEAAHETALSDLIARETRLGDVVRALGRAFLLWMAFGLGLAAVAIRLMNRRLVAPVTELERAVARVAGGDLTGEARVRRQDELGLLATHFNTMTGVLRQRAEQELRHRETLTERFGRILDESGNEIYLFDATTLRIVQANRGARSNLGYRLEELAVLTPLDLLKGVPADAFDGALGALTRGEQPRVILTGTQVRKDGSDYPVEIALQLSAAGNPAVFIAVVTDLSERSAPRALTDRLRQFAVGRNRVLAGGDLVAAAREVTELVAEALRVDRVGVWRWEPGAIRCIDLYARRREAHSSEQPLTADRHPAWFAAVDAGHVFEISDTTADPRTRDLMAGYLAPAGIGAILVAPVHAGSRLGAVLMIEHVGESRHWSAEQQAFAASVADLLALALEASDRRRTEEALRESEERYRAAFEQAGIGVTELGPDGRYLRVNPRFCDMVGYAREELLQRRVYDISHADDQIPDREAIARMSAGTLEVYRAEKRYLHKNGGDVWANITAAPVRGPDGRMRHIVSMVEDLSIRRRLEGQLAQAHRMESIGRLAGGVAHDFNNLLTAILGYLEMAKGELPDDSPVHAELDGIEMAARRAADLTRQLLAFARRQIIEPKVLDLNELTRGADRLLRRLIGEDVELVIHLAPGLGAVRVDPAQFEQVIVNLTVNARDAMPGGGRIVIETSNVHLDAAYAATRPEVTPGDYVQLTVTDTGIGMDLETQSRLFEPFFTTKGLGRGTGLGLATSYGIVRQAGGHIRVYSEVGIGSTFALVLPRVQARPEGVTPLPDAVPAAAPRGRETILLVEDEPPVRELIEATLRSQGYTVISAGNGEEAVSLARTRLAQIDLVVSDVVLPLLGGRELVARLRAERPDLPVIYMSGYPGTALGEDELHAPDVAFQAKPFTQSELAHRVREVLDRRRSRSG